MGGAPAASADTAISVRSGEYLAFLVANGDQLAEVERVVVCERTGDEVYDETLSSGADNETEPNTREDADIDQE
jgi:ParB family transcriptional regulator, chromosome partitioning protein